MSCSNHDGCPRLPLILGLLGMIGSVFCSNELFADDPDFFNLEAPEHLYWTRPLNDPFSRFQVKLAEGQVALDRTSEQAFVVSLLDALAVPVSSQMLVFSTTSLQLSQISPRNPRALYFNDEIYVGWVPGGKIEIASIDPELGCIFFIFDVARDDGRPLQIERSTRCMNCHAGAETRDVPGLTIKSVLPGPRGGSLESYRANATGHEIPLSERFGGWHLTGKHGIAKHRGNVIGKLWKGETSLISIEPGEQFDWARYPVPTSDILAHLVHEHQAGFVNRVVEATYLARAFAHNDGDSLTAPHRELLDKHAEIITRYLFFAEEAALPEGGIEPDGAFTEAFLTGRKPSSTGDALRDLDLRDRMFKFRCSFMIYSKLFAAMPNSIKSRVHRRIYEVLQPGNDDEAFDYLPAAEKAAIRSILSDTLKDLPLKT